MDPHSVLIQLVLILVSARVIGQIAAYFKIPSVVGELLAGIMIGPSIFGLVELTPVIHLLAEIGVILLLFEVGLETDIGRLISAGIKACIVAIGGIIFPFILGFFVCYYLFGCSLLVSLFIGSTLTATSIGITLRVLRDLKKQNSHESQIIIGAAVLDDIIGIIVLAILFEFSISGDMNIAHAGKALSFIMLFFLISPLVAKFFSLIIKRWDEKTDIPGLLPAAMMSLILFFAWIAHQIGAPELLGGFVVGLALSKKFHLPSSSFLKQTPEFSHKVEQYMQPIVYFFAPIFFVSIGLSLNLKTISWNSTHIWTLTLALLVAAIAGKLVSGFLLKKEKFRSKLGIGIAMIPRGEVGLIFANIGLTAGVLKNDTYAAIIIVIVLTTFLPPFALKKIYTRST